MHTKPPIDLAIKINKILQSGKAKTLKNAYGTLDINILIGIVLGAICSFVEKPMLIKVVRKFFVLFNEKQLDDYSNFMMGINNYLVDRLDNNYNEMYLLENNQWIINKEASLDSLCELWGSFYAIMKVEFEDRASELNNLKRNNPVVSETLECFIEMANIIQSDSVDQKSLQMMKTKFPEYAAKFNNLRKLLFMNSVPYDTVH